MKHFLKSDKIFNKPDLQLTLKKKQKSKQNKTNSD